jgi:hypothetical protein
MSADMMSNALKPFAMPFEVQMIFDWAEKLGLLEQPLPNSERSVADWWWLAVALQRDGEIKAPKARQTADPPMNGPKVPLLGRQKGST